MEAVRVGESGLAVSPIVFGCMGFGAGPGAPDWAIDVDTARPLVARALEAGVTTFDTANVYSQGGSEKILGELLKELTEREAVVIATKVYSRMGPGPKGGGLSRAAIISQLDASLRRLGTDYVDLYQLHRYDPEVPIEETMATLNDLVRSGKVRYIGASSMWTWQFAQAQYLASSRGWTRFISMQDQFNLLMREEEREMLPFCRAEGIGVLPWSPLARGRLTRDWDSDTERSRTDAFGAGLYRQAEESDRKIVETVAAIAHERGVSRAQIALAWVLHQPTVTAPIVGIAKDLHLTDSVAATEITLDEIELERLAEHYLPHAPEGFS